MPDLLTPLQTVSSVKSRIVALENGVPQDGNRTRNDSQSQEGRPLLDIAETLQSNSLDSDTDAGFRSKSPSTVNISYRKGHKKVDSTAFLTQTYLTSAPPHNLPDDAREILRSQPDEEDLVAVLKYLQYGIEKKHDFNIQAPSTKTSQITNALVSVTVVDHWHQLSRKHLSQEDASLKRSLISCLTTVTGLGTLLAQIKKLSGPTAMPGGHEAILTDVKSVLETVLTTDRTIYEFIKSTLTSSEKPSQRHVIWQELISLLAGSKILTVVAHSITKSNVVEDPENVISWLADGPRYCAWLARHIAIAAKSLLVKETEEWSMLAQITRRGFSLGDRDTFVSEIYNDLLLGQKASWTALHQLLRSLPCWEQKVFFDGMMRDVARKYLNDSTSSLSLNSTPIVKDRSIEAVAALLAGITKNNEFLQNYAVEWLVDDHGANASIKLRARRAVMATLSNHEVILQKILDRCMDILSDKLQIQHASILQQEATMQTMLLAVAYLRVLNINAIKIVSRSSSYIHAVSNRLGASIPRARYLGMIVGVAVSRLVDEPGKVMDFGGEEMATEESKAWLSLTDVYDEVGSAEQLRDPKPKSTHSNIREITKPSKRKTKPAPTSKIISIEEVEESGSEDEDLVPYQKPDDDPSDSEEDPTLIDRSNPKAPVYILDLIKRLNENDKPDVVRLALKTAPGLIRRKAGFGTELKENVDRLASSLLNLSQGMSKAQAQILRLQALIACVVALPERMGPWLASVYFEGDFSLVQRATLLTTTGLGSRELAGHNDDPKLAQTEESFPSKRLTEKFSSIYAPVNAITADMSRATLQPMALAAADTLTGPNILKVRTFSSRLETERKAAQKSKERSKKIPKDLHKVLAEAFYLPLCCRMSLLLSSRPQIKQSTLFEPHVFKLFLQTLSIIMNTIGPHASQLSNITRETLLLLTQLHSISAFSLDPAILPPMLQLLLSTLDLNIVAGTSAEERLVTDFGQNIAELMAWIVGLQNMNIPTQGDDGMPWTVIAAGCQVKWQEVGRKFQGRMVGLMGGDMDNF